MELGKQIYELRKKANLSQEQLAERVGVSHEFIRRIESKKGAKTFSVDTVWKIALALDIDPGRLFEVDMIEIVQL